MTNNPYQAPRTVEPVPHGHQPPPVSEVERAQVLAFAVTFTLGILSGIGMAAYLSRGQLADAEGRSLYLFFGIGAAIFGTFGGWFASKLVDRSIQPWQIILAFGVFAFAFALTLTPAMPPLGLIAALHIPLTLCVGYAARSFVPAGAGEQN